MTAIYKNWTLLESVVENNSIELLKIYRDYCADLNNNSESKSIKTKFNELGIDVKNIQASEPKVLIEAIEFTKGLV